MCVPTRFVRDRVNTLYGDRLRELWRAEDDAITGIDIDVSPETAGRKPSLIAAPPPEPEPVPAPMSFGTSPYHGWVLGCVNVWECMGFV